MNLMHVLTSIGHSRIAEVSGAIREHAVRYRVFYIFLALVLFLGGLWVSVRSIDASELDVAMLPLLLNALVGAPLAIALNAFSFQAAGQVIGQRVRFMSAFHTCATATASNLLPVPAGTVLQSAALVKHGGGLANSGLIIIIGNVVLMAIVSVLLGCSLVSGYPRAGITLVLVGGLVLLSCVVQIFRSRNLGTAAFFVGARASRIFLMVLRIQLSFLAIGTSITLLDAAGFTAAVVLGTVVAVVPAGIGVSESLGALTAVAIAIAPGAAFIAIALNRISTILVAALMAAMMSIGKPMRCR